MAPKLFCQPPPIFADPTKKQILKKQTLIAFISSKTNHYLTNNPSNGVNLIYVP